LVAKQLGSASDPDCFVLFSLKGLETNSKQNNNQYEIISKHQVAIDRPPNWSRPCRQIGDILHTNISVRLINITAAALAGAALLVGAECGAAHAANRIVAVVSLSQQIMEVAIDGRPTFAWKVSTGDRTHVTPTGSFKPTRMHEMWYSKKYDNAPMPHSVFFSGGYAVHATYAVKRLGQPASHGCVRLHPDNAADFYQLVETFGPANTSILIVK
jgi:L,D-transpeptidase catalytic domain